jgi:hypothetical protein
MGKCKFLLALPLLFALSAGKLKSQSCVAILLNEYSATNITGPTDNFGLHSDWVELLNVHTSSVSLGGWYLSNDRLNLKKWRVPDGFKMAVGELKVIWLSGKNTTINGEYHANFNLDQCKDQWLILTSPTGALHDSVFVQKTKQDHTRGRIDCSLTGIKAWRLYTSHSWMQNNPMQNYYKDYAPTPKFVLSTQTAAQANKSPQPGGWFDGAQLGWFRLENMPYDTTTSCYDIFYTINGDYPQPFYPGDNQGNYYRVFDTLIPLPLEQTTMIRCIAVPRPGYTVCPVNEYLPSFCETNTYFIDAEHGQLKQEFGVVSLAMDTSWFRSNGTSAATIHAEYYDNKTQFSEGYALAVRPVNEEWITAQKGFHMTIDDRFGFGCNFEGTIFNVDSLGTSTRTLFPTLHLKGGDFESYSKQEYVTDPKPESTGLRDILIQSLAARYKLNVNPLHVKPVIAFINGFYWGVFDLREIYDKYYEGFYNRQSRDSVDLRYFHLQDGNVTYLDGSVSKSNANFRVDVHDYAMKYPMNVASNYNTLMSRLDKSSFMDYMILQSYFMNSNLWNYNIAYAKGPLSNRPGYKWHYYLWNMPATLNFTAIATNTTLYNSANTSPCIVHSRIVSPSLLAGMFHR